MTSKGPLWLPTIIMDTGSLDGERSVPPLLSVSKGFQTHTVTHRSEGFSCSVINTPCVFKTNHLTRQRAIIFSVCAGCMHMCVGEGEVVCPLCTVWPAVSSLHPAVHYRHVCPLKLHRATEIDNM